MIKINNYDNVIASGITYGGHSGSKKGIIWNNEKWFLKYPKSTKSMDVLGLSYTTSPISEYIGSCIYESIGIDVHKTELGIANEKVVVACRDFLAPNEVILDYNSIKNDYDELIEKQLEELSSSSSSNFGTDLEEVLIIMKNNDYFINNPELSVRFWQMFIIDAFISNNDRNDNNWGLVLNKETMNLRIVPVYDNGAAFYSKSSNEKIDGILNDDFKLKQVIYDSCVSNFTIDGKHINPLKYIEGINNDECNKVLIDIFPKINMDNIKKIFDDIPKEYNGLSILSNEQRELYYKSLLYKYNNVLKPTYDKLIK